MRQREVHSKVVRMVLASEGTMNRLDISGHGQNSNPRLSSWLMVGAIGFEFWVTRSFNNIEARRAPLKQWKAVVDSSNGSQMDHKQITALVSARSST